MPKPVWVERKKQAKRAMREGESLLDNDTFVDALDEIEASDDAAFRAARDPEGFFRDKGVTLPEGLTIVEAKRGSCTYCVSFWGVRTCITFP